MTAVTPQMSWGWSAPVPGAGAFAVGILARQVGVRSAVNGNSNISSTSAGRLPAGGIGGDADDGEDGVVALSGLVQGQASDQLDRAWHQVDFLESLAQGGGADVVVGLGGASAREADVGGVFAEAGCAPGQQDRGLGARHDRHQHGREFPLPVVVGKCSLAAGQSGWRDPQVCTPRTIVSRIGCRGQGPRRYAIAILSMPCHFHVFLVPVAGIRRRAVTQDTARLRGRGARRRHARRVRFCLIPDVRCRGGVGRRTAGFNGNCGSGCSAPPAGRTGSPAAGRSGGARRPHSARNHTRPAASTPAVRGAGVLSVRGARPR